MLIKWSSYIISSIHSQWFSYTFFFFTFWHLNFLSFLLFLENASFLTRNCDLLALLQCYSCIFDTTNMLDMLPAMHEHSFLLLILAACGWLYVSYWIPFSLFNIQLFLSLFAIFFSPLFFYPFILPPNFSFFPAFSSSMRGMVHIKNIQLWLDV